MAEQEQRVRHQRLRTEAVYEVIERGEKVTLVRVVEAPGLEPGTELRLTTEAVDRMQPA